jgi:hypothetical protein
MSMPFTKRPASKVYGAPLSFGDWSSLNSECHRRPSFATMGRQWGREILDLIERMWAQEPASRPRMSQVLEEVERMYYERKHVGK